MLFGRASALTATDRDCASCATPSGTDGACALVELVAEARKRAEQLRAEDRAEEALEVEKLAATVGACRPGRAVPYGAVSVLSSWPKLEELNRRPRLALPTSGEDFAARA